MKRRAKKSRLDYRTMYARNGIIWMLYISGTSHKELAKLFRLGVPRVRHILVQVTARLADGFCGRRSVTDHWALMAALASQEPHATCTG